MILEEPDVVAAGQFLETFADIWVEAIPKERKELLGLLLEEVLVDVAEERLIKRMRSHSLTLVGYSFDVVLSAGLLTQMLQTVEDAKLKPDETLELALELRR